MSEQASERKASVLLYSDDRTVRQQVRFALGRRLAADLPELEIAEYATHQAVIHAMDTHAFDVAILDGEAVPAGGMGVAYQLKDEIPNCPPIVLLVARVADAWLATWSRADAVVPYPVDPERLPAAVAKVLRARLASEAAAG